MEIENMSIFLRCRKPHFHNLHCRKFRRDRLPLLFLIMVSRAFKTPELNSWQKSLGDSISYSQVKSHIKSDTVEPVQ